MFSPPLKNTKHDIDRNTLVEFNCGSLHNYHVSYPVRVKKARLEELLSLYWMGQPLHTKFLGGILFDIIT